ncbi:hypothetical protein J4Q44_G00320450 [Coregonus suidteri]|uniref:Uncharacterized protein n=1 Tax=Coregonus suidteri TaxID=861788 RepID=A0AAN8KU17_9TELE
MFINHAFQLLQPVIMHNLTILIMNSQMFHVKRVSPLLILHLSILPSIFPSVPPSLRVNYPSCVVSLFGRYFHSPTDTKELLYDPASVMNGDTLRFCQKEAWCKMSFFVLSFFYYLYCMVYSLVTS